MDDESKILLHIIGFEFTECKNMDGIIISRENLLSDTKYDEIKKYIPNLKKKYSSSFMTCLQKNADKSQKWPLLNLVRQILNVYGYKMVPIRKADGYTLEGIKKYKRYFQVKYKQNNKINIKKNELQNNLEMDNIIEIHNE